MCLKYKNFGSGVDMRYDRDKYLYNTIFLHFDKGYVASFLAFFYCKKKSQNFTFTGIFTSCKNNQRKFKIRYLIKEMYGFLNPFIQKVKERLLKHSKLKINNGRGQEP